MKRISKILNFCILLTFAVSCNDDKIVELKVFNTPVTYKTAIGCYWGDYFDSGTANFQLWLYSDSDEKIGILIDGYASLPTNPANFRLDAGTYSVTDNERVRTVFPSDEDIEATFAFNERTDRKILINEGGFTVSLSGNIYTIETNFSGIDGNSGLTVDDIRIIFTGQIFFENMTLSFNDITESSYAATGIPYSPNRSISWQGELFPDEDEIGPYFGITNWYNTANWASVTHPLYLDFVNGKLILDDQSKVGENGDYDLYYGASYFTGSSWGAVPEYRVSYNKTTRILDFGGTYDGHPVYVGIWGKHYITGDEVVYDGTKVRDAKLELIRDLKSTHNLTTKKRMSSVPYNRIVETEHYQSNITVQQSTLSTSNRTQDAVFRQNSRSKTMK